MATKKTKKAGSAKNANNQKIINLAPYTEEGTNEFMTTNQGLKINDDQNSLKAGDRALRCWKILY